MSEPGGARLRHRLTPLTARSETRGTWPYQPYCPRAARQWLPPSAAPMNARRPLKLPETFPDTIALVATDFDRTLIAEDAELRPRTLSALRAARDAGLRVVVVTGRMFRSVRPYLAQAGLTDP